MSIRRGCVPIAMILALLAAAGCAHVPRPQLGSLWPWHKTAPAAPEAVHELDVTVPTDVAIPIVLQYWHRNALLIDLQGVASSGAVILRPRAGAGWPIRLEFRVQPGRFPVLELQGAQRHVYPITAATSEPVIVAVEPALYPPATTQIAVSWGAAAR
jgi:hypothetical protein